MFKMELTLYLNHVKLIQIKIDIKPEFRSQSASCLCLLYRRFAVQLVTQVDDCSFVRRMDHFGFRVLEFQLFMLAVLWCRNLGSLLRPFWFCLPGKLNFREAHVPRQPLRSLEQSSRSVLSSPIHDASESNATYAIASSHVPINNHAPGSISHRRLPSQTDPCFYTFYFFLSNIIFSSYFLLCRLNFFLAPRNTKFSVHDKKKQKNRMSTDRV